MPIIQPEFIYIYILITITYFLPIFKKVKNIFLVS